MTDLQTRPTEAAAPRRSIVRIGILGIAAAALIGASILALGMTSAPSGILAADTTGPTTPLAGFEAPRGNGPMDKRGGEGRFGPITITAISGSNLSLRTGDGWTRTIAITGDTELMKGTATIAAADLKVGDEVRFRQEVQTDGSFKITELHVVQPHVGGSVTAVSGTTITVTQRDGTTATIKVTSGTTYQVGRTDGKALTDIKVGMLAGAVGTLNSDGSLTASAVHAVDPASLPGFGGRHDHRGPGANGPWGGSTSPVAPPDASAG